MRYNYTPLRTDRQEIRILHLEPCRPRRNRSGPKTPPIRLRIETVTLHDAGEYTCISYTWGAPEPKHTIQVNGHDFDVRANLFAVLCRLRLPDKPRRLWIDAISINQDSIPERDSQVAMMRYIFQKATDVIAWIGEDNGSQDERAVKFVRTLSARAQGVITQRTDSIDARTAAWLASITPWALVGSIWMDFIALVERPWFSRIWIVQEIVMAKTTTVWCGQHQLDWMEFFHCSLFIRKYRKLITSFVAPYCLRYHDPGKSKIFFEDKPLCRLFRAADDIDAVGYWVSTRQLSIISKDLVGKNWWASDLSRNKRPSDAVWAEFDSKSPNVRLYLSRPLENLPAATEPDERLLDVMVPQTQNTQLVNRPDVLRTLLHYPPGGRKLFAVSDDGIPVFDVADTDDTRELFADAQMSKHPDLAAYEFTKSVAISGDRISSRAGWTMYNIVHRFRTFQATDARDKVYALIGLAADVAHALGFFPRISYADNVSVLDVFWDLIDLELQSHRGLGLLSHACGLDRPEGVPSWMPLWYDDVSDKPSTPCGLQSLQVSSVVRYYADNDYADYGDTQVAYLDKPKGMLYVHGTLQSKIYFLGDAYDRDLDELDRLNTRLKWATMLGVERLDKVHHILLRLRRVGLLSAKDASDRFSVLATQLAMEEAVIERHDSFFGTLLASASTAGTQHLVDQPPKHDPFTTANVQDQCSAAQDTDSRIDNRIAEVCHGRRLFICSWGRHTAQGHVQPTFGLCPANTQVEDLVVVLFGSSTPQVIRKVDEDEEGNIYELVGEAYVHGWMQGQMVPKEAMRPYRFRLR